MNAFLFDLAHSPFESLMTKVPLHRIHAGLEINQAVVHTPLGVLSHPVQQRLMVRGSASEQYGPIGILTRVDGMVRSVWMDHAVRV